jgi:uncharacterized protein YjbI with pentapeptide repeats
MISAARLLTAAAMLSLTSPVWAEGLLRGPGAEGLNLGAGCRTERFCNWADLHGADLSGQDLTEKSYEGANLEGAKFRGSKLSYVVFHVSDSIGADFSQADLQGATFFTSNIEGGNFSGSNLKGVNFTRANLSKANFQGAQIDRTTLFIHAKLDGAIWTDGRVCAAGSDGACK